jgi:cobalt-zinc-cadmium efflux system protein
VSHSHSHDHPHPHEHPHPHAENGVHRPRERRRLLATVVLTSAMMVVEVVGGLLTGSLALISDAGHMLTHAMALGVSLAAIVLAARPAPPERGFGYYRVEVLAALFNGATLVAITAFIFYQAAQRFLHPAPILGMQMFVVAGIGLVVNLLSVALLHDTDREDLNTRSAFLHMVGDTLSSVAVVAGAVVIWATGWTVIDPALSVLICLVILRWAWRLIAESVHILMEAAPRGADPPAIEHTIRSVCGEACRVRKLYLWTITSGMPVLAAHVGVPDDGTAAADPPLDRLRAALRDAHGIAHVTIQFERVGED